MTADEFDRRPTFAPEEVDYQWHIYAALLVYGLNTPQARENPRFTEAVQQQKFMFDMMFERMES